MSTRAPISNRPLRESFPRLADHPQLRGRQLKDLENDIERVRLFTARHVRPRALEYDRRVAADTSDFAWDVARAGSREGLFTLILPAAAGGDGNQFCTRSSLVMEEISAGCAGVATIFGAHALGVSPLVMAGPTFWDTMLKKIADGDKRGEPVIMACAITEPTAGTDVEHHELVHKAHLASSAKRVKGGYVLNGTKQFISNGPVASWTVVIMPTDPKRPYETMSAFLVDAKSKGYSVGHTEHKMGQRACLASEIILEDVFVPEQQVVGRIGDGVPFTMAVLAASRPVVGGIATGIARGAYERLLDWLIEDPDDLQLLQRQEVQIALARMEEEIHLSRQAYLDAATEFDVVSMGKLLTLPAVRLLAAMPRQLRTNPVARRQLESGATRDMVVKMIEQKVSDRNLTRALGLSSMAKARGGDTAMKVTGMALEIAGLGCGALRPELEKLMRDAKLCQIFEGTNQLNRLEAFEGLVMEDSMHVLEGIATRPSPNGDGAKEAA